MARRWLTAGPALGALGVGALLLTPSGTAPPGALARAGADIPLWGFVVVGLILLAGLALLLLGSRRRRRDEEPVAGTAEEPSRTIPAATGGGSDGVASSSDASVATQDRHPDEPSS